MWGSTTSVGLGSGLHSVSCQGKSGLYFFDSVDVDVVFVVLLVFLPLGGDELLEFGVENRYMVMFVPGF